METFRTGSALRKHPRNQRVSSFVVGGHQPLALGNNSALALRAGEHAIDRLGNFVASNGFLVTACRQDRRLVDQVLEIGARKSRGLASEIIDRDIVFERLPTSVHFQNRAGVRKYLDDRG